MSAPLVPPLADERGPDDAEAGDGDDTGPARPWPGPQAAADVRVHNGTGPPPPSAAPPTPARPPARGAPAGQAGDVRAGEAPEDGPEQGPAQVVEFELEVETEAEEPRPLGCRPEEPRRRRRVARRHAVRPRAVGAADLSSVTAEDPWGLPCPWAPGRPDPGLFLSRFPALLPCSPAAR